MTDEIASFKVTAADIQEQRKATFRGRPHDLGGHFFWRGGGFGLIFGYRWAKFLHRLQFSQILVTPLNAVAGNIAPVEVQYYCSD